MPDAEPILFRKVFGSLRPVTPAAVALVEGLDPARNYRCDVKGIRGNTRRLALYWVCLRVACEQLSDAVEGVLTPRLLHRWLKRDLGFSTPIVSKKTGEVIEWDDESIAFENMSEAERTKFIDAALERISARLGCDVTQLREEAQAEIGEAA